MNRIKILPEAVKRKIAAGEVVEGPFSIVKELVENSIDAMATEIDVEVLESGLKKIIVRDNGAGILKEDLPLAVKEHATSKIQDIGDIDSIYSYGFRGEALSSISSISRLTIITRSKEEDEGSKLVCAEGGMDLSAFAGNPGTLISVENLFYNVPARKKFLKARSTEMRYIREILLRMALANPSVSFSLTVDGKRQFTLAGTQKHDERVEQVYGKETSESLIFERLSDIKVEISGYLSKPEFLKTSRSMQSLFVNSRFIDYKYLGFLLSRAYEAIASKGKYPAALLFITIEPSLLDVNIHPAKREIKFFDQSYIDSMIVQLARKALGGRVHDLNSSMIRPSLKKDASGDENEEEILKEPALPLRTQEFSLPPKTAGSVYRDDNYTEPVAPMHSRVNDIADFYRDVSSESDYRVVGTAFGTYIIAEKKNEIIFIDFHAAHERIIFDSLMDKDFNIDIQQLAFPKVIELSIEDFNILMEQTQIFRESGFDIEEFSESSVVVRGIPVAAGTLDVDGFFIDIIETIKNEKAVDGSIKERILERVACHSAKRANDSLSERDMISLTGEVLSGKHQFRCPHGRPYIYKMGKSDLEKIFKR